MDAQENHWEQKDSLYEFKKIAGLILSKWYWIALSFILSLAIGYLGFIRYVDPVFVVNATFISKKFDESGENRLAEFAETFQFRQRIESHQELPLLKSQDKIEETLKRVDFGTSYFAEGRFKLTELYKNTPFTVITDSSSQYVPYGAKIFLISEDQFKYRLFTDNEKLNKLIQNKEFSFDTDYQLQGWMFSVKLNSRSIINKDERYFFIINNPRSLLSQFRSKLNLSWTYVNSAIITVKLQGELPEKDYDFLEAYLEVVIEKGLEEKNQYLSNTIEFIDEYLLHITDTLYNQQTKVDNFKLDNSELINGSSFVFNQLNALDNQRIEIELSNRYYDYILEYIKDNRSEEVFAPNLIGLDVSPLSELVNRYMEIKWQDKVDKNINNEKNPLVNRSNEEYERLEENIFESIRNLKAMNDQKLDELDEQTQLYKGTILNYQPESREFREVNRMLSLYEQVFNNLITRRSEAYIAKASTVSDYQIVTPPSYNRNNPISPNTQKVYTFSILLGLGIPIGLIYLFFMLNEKVISKDDLQKRTNIPILGNVSHSAEKNNLVVSDRPKSIVSESFRSVRANIKYFHPNGQSLTILVTSYISGEGKTFCSTNLAYTYALAEKKTVLLGADLRKPAFAVNFQLTKAKGLSNYLAGMVEEKEIFHATDNEFLTVVPGGKIPPNPVELLMSSKMTDFIKSLKDKYDVIIIDTPPIGIVSDSMEMLRFSDVNLLIVRQGVTYKKSLAAITETYNIGRIKNLAIIFNDINFKKYEYGYALKGYGSRYGYEYGYGHGYYDEEDEKEGFWKKWFGNGKG